MALADAGALWKLGFCGGGAENRRRDIAVAGTRETTRTPMVVFKILTSRSGIPFRGNRMALVISQKRIETPPPAASRQYTEIKWMRS